MAFCTSRIDDKGNGTEFRHSARSLASSINGSNSRYNLSSRSYDNTKSSVRYINSAAFIENSIPLKDFPSEDNMKCSGISQTQSDIVPPLDLKSEENYPTIYDYTFSYRKHCETAKIVLKPDQAFETWLSAKRKLLSDEAARRKKAEEQKQKEIEERKRLAKEKYEKWLEKKTRSQQFSQLSLGQQSNITTNSTLTTSDANKRSQISKEEANARLKEWEQEKRLENERRLMLKRQEQQRRRELEEQRRQMAAEAWKKWIADAAKKPKPVPLNRGIFTLRGTVSDIFVNPNEWKPIIPVKNDD